MKQYVDFFVQKLFKKTLIWNMRGKKQQKHLMWRLAWFQKHSRNCVGIVSCLCIPVVSGYDFGSLLVTL